MNIYKKNILRILTCAFLFAAPAFPGFAQTEETFEIEPLFEYPMAPEDIPTLAGKSNYLMEHFWDNMNFKVKGALDQNAVNDAMKVFVTPLRWADKDKADVAIGKLIDKISKNPTLLLQFTKGAEETMYSPRADVWIDEIYLKFLQAIVKNKKVPESRRNHYAEQLKTIGNTLIGGIAPEFKFTAPGGEKKTYMPMSTPTLIIFGNPKSTDWRLARLRMETNVNLRQAIEKGKANILYIVPFVSDTWEIDTNGYSNSWTVGYAPEISTVYDNRVMPSIYVIGNDGKIVNKNVTLDEALSTLLSLTTELK